MVMEDIAWLDLDRIQGVSKSPKPMLAQVGFKGKQEEEPPVSNGSNPHLYVESFFFSRQFDVSKVRSRHQNAARALQLLLVSSLLVRGVILG